LLPCPVTTGYQQSEPANVADVGWGLGVAIGNLGGGSPLTIIAATLAEPSAEMSLILPNGAAKIDDFANISAIKWYWFGAKS